MNISKTAPDKKALLIDDPSERKWRTEAFWSCLAIWTIGTTCSPTRLSRYFRARVF